MNNIYGKYPMEPYGAMGGFYRKETNGVAAGLGSIAGWLIGSIAYLVFKLATVIVKLIFNTLKKSYAGLRNGLTDAIKK